jgi:hypothetical protein
MFVEVGTDPLLKNMASQPHDSLMFASPGFWQGSPFNKRCLDLFRGMFENNGDMKFTKCRRVVDLYIPAVFKAAVEMYGKAGKALFRAERSKCARREEFKR